MPFRLFRSVPSFAFAALLIAAPALHAQLATLQPAPDTCATAPGLCPSLSAAENVLPANAPAAYPASALQVIASLPSVANAVIQSPDGRTFVLFPRLEGKPGVRLAEVKNGTQLIPFPDDTWNSVPTPSTVAQRFIRLNSIRFGPDGNLWVIDTGARSFADPPAPNAAKVLVFNIDTRKLVRSYPLQTLLTKKSYIDDIRFGAGPQKGLAYLTDAGAAGLIVLDLRTGQGRRTLDNAVSTTDERPMRAEGKVLRKPNGEEIKVQADQLEVSPDGRFFYFEPSSGPLYRVETRYLADASLPSAELEKHVTLFANTPSTGGTAIDSDGNIYMSDVDHNRILKITPAGHISLLVASPLLQWADAMWIDSHGDLLIPAAQMNHTAPLNGGHDAVQLPVKMLRLHLGVAPEAQGEAR